MPIEIPKLKFGEAHSIAWVKEWCEKLKLRNQAWIDGKAAIATPCCVCNREIGSRPYKTDGPKAIHEDCLADLKDLALRSGGGA